MILRYLLIVLLTCISCSIFAAKTANLFNTAGRTKLFNYKGTGQNFRFGKTPDGFSAYILSSMDFRRKKYAEIKFNPGIRFNRFNLLKIILRYYSKGKKDITNCAIRMTDAKGETFQWSVGAGDDKPGWKTLNFNVQPSNFRNSWGAGADKQLDFPVTLSGLGVEFSSKTTGSPIWFASLSYEEQQAETVKKGVKAIEFSWNFDDSELWRGKIQQTPAGIRLSGHDPRYWLSEKKFPLISYNNLTNAEIEIDLHKGKASFEIFLRDGTNKMFHSKTTPIQKGKHSYKIQFPQMFPPVKISHVGISDKSKNLDMTLCKATFYGQKPLLDAIKLDVVTGNPIHVLKVGDESKLALELNNTSGKRIIATAKFTLINIDEDKIQFQRKIMLKPHQKQLVPVSLPKNFKQGLWYVKSQFAAKGSKPAMKECSFAYIIPAGPVNEKPVDFLYSICSHTERWSLRDQELEAMVAALSGAKIVRTFQGWCHNEPQSGHWDLADNDRLVETFGKYGIELQPIFCFTPGWAVNMDTPNRFGKYPKSKTNNRNMPKLEAFRNYVRTLARRYNNKIHYWETWNEPDLDGFAQFGPEDLAKLQAIAYDELKKVNPDNKVLTAGFAFVKLSQSVLYQYRALSKSMGKFDMHAIHEHGSFEQYQGSIDGPFRKLRQQLGIADQPWYSNETALHCVGGKEKLQAETLFMKLLFARARGAAGYTWYDLRNDGFSTLNGEHNFGLFTNDFYPKPVYAAYAALVNTYRGMKFKKQLKLNSGEWGFVFGNDSTQAVASWRAEDANGNGIYAIGTDGEWAEKVDLMGNTSPVELNGRYFLWNPDRPATVKIYNASKVEAKHIVSSKVLSFAVAGKNLPVEFTINNPFPETRTFRFYLKPPKIFFCDEPKFQIVVPAGESVKKIVNFQVAGRVDLKEAYPVKVKVKIGDNNQTILRLITRTARSIKTDVHKRNPDFKLNTRRNIVVLYDAQPDKPFWTGPKDLSAQVMLGIENNNLIVKVNVEDDIQLQKAKKDKMIWEGDSVQFAVIPAGQKVGWEIGGAFDHSGKARKYIWNYPETADYLACTEALNVSVTRMGKITSYVFQVPVNVFHLESAIKNGFRFNLVVNDADEETTGREGWARIAPGLAGSKDFDRYPLMLFDK